MTEQYTYPNNDAVMASEDIAIYPQGVTIPINLPSIGDYSVEFLKKELTDFAMNLLRRSASKPSAATHINWRDMELTDKVKSMSLGPSALSCDTRTDKELLAEALEEKYK